MFTKVDVYGPVPIRPTVGRGMDGGAQERPLDPVTHQKSPCSPGWRPPELPSHRAGAHQKPPLAELEGAGGGLVEEPGGVLDGDAAGGGLLDGAVLGEGTGDGVGLALARDEEPDLARSRLRAAKVREMRSGGGLGESVTATAISSSTSSWGKPGNSDAT